MFAHVLRNLAKKRNKHFRVIFALRLQRRVSNYEVAMAIHDSDTGEELC